MATHERPQSGKSSRAEDEDVPAVAPSPDAAERKEAIDSDIDAILDEIDEVLEVNAEEFVRGFVQKGGQ
ncbi:MAG: ubiquitin-like protein Pup [Candidatus Nanopelagicales bacterium]|nr:ubiquitin-like protein Pup [Candidatus Nanopelagicales bacterium]MDZ4250063.1 ubiquitin-like protein Pup [Candidatus Nanopelagicales bacterium]MDZ7577742.1 ubiquitin-like protein Pup [Candidatus Nanopelagicales bacterium]